MRKGNEADFDASKLMSGEWAVSLDAGIVRICLEAGKVIRMATYEAFEEDMKQVEAILLECQSIEEAVRRINTEVSEKLNACAEYVQQAKGYSEQAKQYRDEALQFRNEAEQFAPEGYAELKEQVNENTFKIDTVIAKADLGITETASGEEIHLTDSAEGKAVEFALYGKARQETTSGKNLCPNISGTYTLNTGEKEIDLPAGTYTISLDISSTDTDNGESYLYLEDGNGNGLITNASLFYIPRNATLSRRTLTFTISGNAKKMNIYAARSYSTSAGDTLVIDNVQIESGTVATPFEPFTNGASPNPDYPQEIEVSGESYNLLPYPYTDTTTEVNGITFTDNGDGSITFNGTATATAVFHAFSSSEDNFGLEVGEYILSGCPNDGSDTTYRLDILNQSSVIAFEHGSGKNFTYDGQNGGIRKIRIVVYAGKKFENVTFKPMIRKAHVKRDRYMPFGVNRVEVKSCGKNLVSDDWKQGMLSTTDGKTVSSNNYWLYTNKYVEVDNSKKYTFSCDTTCQGVVYFYDENKTFLSYIQPLRNNISSAITIPNTTKYIRFGYNYSGGSQAITPEQMGVLHWLQLEIGNATEYQPYKETLSTIPTPNGLAGIKVASNGNYTDQNGQQWICDEIVKYADGSGEYIERIKHYSLAVADMNNGNDYPGWKMPFTDDLVEVVGEGINRQYTDIALNIGQNANFNTKSNNKTIFLSKETYGMTQTEWQTKYPDLVVDIYIPRVTPITTPLTAEEIAEISTFYPITNISNDFACGMSVKYNCDSKNYIDKQLAEMERAREQAMMSMFLLLPEETQATMIENDVNNLLTESEN